METNGRQVEDGERDRQIEISIYRDIEGDLIEEAGWRKESDEISTERDIDISKGKKENKANDKQY